MRNKYLKTTGGINAQVIVAKATAYTDSTTYQAFVNEAVDGEIGVFLVYDASGPTTYTEATAVANTSDAAFQAGDKIFIAQMNIHSDSFAVSRRFVKKTPVFTYGEFTVVQKAYVAPVKQIVNVGYTGTSGSLNSGTLVNGQIFPIKLIENTPANQPFPTWAYEEVSKQGDTLQSIGARLTKQFNDTTFAQNNYNGILASGVMLTNGSFSASSGGAATMVNGSTTFTIVESAGAAADAGKYAADVSSLAAGLYIRIGGTTDTSPVYKISAVSGIGSALATITLDSPYQGSSGSVAAANLGVITSITEIGFKFTALDNGASFRVALDEDLVSADLAYTTPYKEGNGTYNQVAQMELEGQVFEGYGLLNDSFQEDWGKPANYADSSTTYQFIFLNYYRAMKAASVPNVQDRHYGNIILALPVGVAPTTDLDGMFV